MFYVFSISFLFIFYIVSKRENKYKLIIGKSKTLKGVMYAGRSVVPTH